MTHRQTENSQNTDRHTAIKEGGDKRKKYRKVTKCTTKINTLLMSSGYLFTSNWKKCIQWYSMGPV